MGTYTARIAFIECLQGVIHGIKLQLHNRERAQENGGRNSHQNGDRSREHGEDISISVATIWMLALKAGHKMQNLQVPPDS